MITIKKILYPMGFSEYTYWSLKLAISLAVKHKSQLHLLNVVEYIQENDRYNLPLSRQEIFNRMDYECKKLQKVWFLWIFPRTCL